MSAAQGGDKGELGGEGQGSSRCSWMSQELYEALSLTDQLLDTFAETVAAASAPPPQRCEACGETAPWWDHIVHEASCPRRIVLIVRKAVAASGGEEAP